METQTVRPQQPPFCVNDGILSFYLYAADKDIDVEIQTHTLVHAGVCMKILDSGFCLSLCLNVRSFTVNLKVSYSGCTYCNHLLLVTRVTHSSVIWQIRRSLLLMYSARVHAGSLSHDELCNSLDCSPPGSSVHGIFQARILKWVTISSFRGSSQHRDWTWVSCVFCIAGGFFTAEPSGKPH